MTIEILPGGFNAVDSNGDVVPLDDVDPQFPEVDPYGDALPLDDVDSQSPEDVEKPELNQLIEAAFKEGEYSPDTCKRIMAVLEALDRSKSLDSPCKKDGRGIPIVVLLGRLEYFDKIDPRIIGVLKARVAEHNEPFVSARRQSIGHVASAAPNVTERAPRERDWAERAAGEAVWRPDDDM